MQSYFMNTALFYKFYIYSTAVKKYFYNLDVEIDVPA